MSLSQFAVKKPTTVLIFTIILVLLGVYSVSRLPMDLYPNMEIPYMVVSSSYPGATPEEVEEKLTRTLEGSLSSVTGLKNITSTSTSGASIIILELEQGTDLSEAANQMRDRIDLIRNYLPDDATSPIIIQMDPSMLPVMTIALESSVSSAETIYRIADDIIVPRLEQVEGVASVSISGGSEQEVKVEVAKDRLDAYGLTMSQVIQMIAAQNSNISAGEVHQGDIAYSVTLSGEMTTLEDIRNTTVTYLTTTPTREGVDLVPVVLGDIADVYIDYKDRSNFAYVNGQPSILLSVQKQSSKNSLDTAQNVVAAFDRIQREIPSDITMNVVYDSTEYITKSVDNVSESAITGAVLAIIVILLFLRSVRSTLIISISIPVSILITFIAMYFSGLTLNMMTLAGLSLGVGMLVDNSIVILENIYSYRQRGAKPTVAAVLGSKEMSSAITSSTLTTICVFLPMLMYGSQLGLISQVLTGLAFTVVASLLASLLVAITLVPTLSSKYLIASVRPEKKGNRLSGYKKVIRWTLHHKVLVIGVILILFILALMAIPQIGFVYMPTQDETSVSLNVEMRKGTTLDASEDIAIRFYEDSMKLLTGIKNTNISSGNTMSSLFGTSSTNEFTITYNLYTQSEREAGYDDAESVKAKLRTLFASYPEASFSFSSTSLTSLGTSGIDVKIAGNDYDMLIETAQDIQAKVSTQLPDMVGDVTTTVSEGLPQVEVVYDRARMRELGFNIATVNAEVRAQLYGTTAGTITMNGTEYDITVSLPESEKVQRSTLESLMVTNSQGARYPLTTIATIQETTGPESISRENQTRTLHVNVSTLPGVSSRDAQTAIQRVISSSVVLPEGMTITYEGEYEDLIEGLQIFAEIIAIAAILVFAVMASQFESFKSPFIVIFTFPLAVIGIVAIYLMTGQTFSLITAVGLLILVGIIVNNGIVLVDYTNLLVKRGYSVEDACVEASASRLRPILMTTLTTVLALIPMAFFPGEGSELVQPIGQTIFGGMTFGSAMTLFLMPSIYYIFNIGKEKKRKKQQRRIEADEKV